ncbi:catalase, partial [Vibrio cholerae]
VNYVKFHWKSLQGIESLRPDEVVKVQGQDFNHLTNDLYTQIN